MSPEIDWWGDQGSSNPGMPSDTYGIRFPGGATTMTYEFDSPRMPKWGDFYSKDGKKPGTDTVNTVWNVGFGNPDTDPAALASNGSVDFHILVPDTQLTHKTPEPATLVLLGAGLGGLVLRRRRARA